MSYGAPAGTLPRPGDGRVGEKIRISDIEFSMTGHWHPAGCSLRLAGAGQVIQNFQSFRLFKQFQGLAVEFSLSL